MIFVVPACSHVYRYLGPFILFFFALTKYFQGELSLINLKCLKFNMPALLFSILILLSFISFVPQTVGTMLIFATLYFGLNKKIIVDKVLGKIFLTIILIILTYWTYLFLHKIPFAGNRINSNYLGAACVLYLCCCVKLDFWPGQLMTIIGAYFITARLLHVSLLVYFVSRTPVLKKVLSIEPVAIYIIFVTCLLIITGALFANKPFIFPSHPKRGYSLAWHEQTLNRFSSGRVKLNNNFLKYISGDNRKILFGDRLNYKTNKNKVGFDGVHHSFLDIFAQQGILFLIVYLTLLYSFFKKHAQNKDFSILIIQFTCGSLLAGLFNTFPLILLLCLVLIKDENATPQIL